MDVSDSDDPLVNALEQCVVPVLRPESKAIPGRRRRQFHWRKALSLNTKRQGETPGKALQHIRARLVGGH